MKRCKHCKALKPVEDFYRDKAAADGLRPECKACTAAERKVWYEANRDREIARVQQWRAENPERYLATQRRRQQSPEAKRREREGHLKRKYGITIEQYDAMLEAQGGGCAICGRPPSANISLHVDHDHESGRVRGIVCFKHNNALGDFDDDPQLLRKAADYLDPVDPEEIALVRRRAHELVANRTH